MNEGFELGLQRAEDAGNNAGTVWKDIAYNNFVEFSKQHNTFTTEMVRLAYPNMPQPPHLRAWGQVATRAKRNNVVVSSGLVKSEVKNKHGIPVTLWRTV